MAKQPQTLESGLKALLNSTEAPAPQDVKALLPRQEAPVDTQAQARIEAKAEMAAADAALTQAYKDVDAAKKILADAETRAGNARLRIHNLEQKTEVESVQEYFAAQLSEREQRSRDYFKAIETGMVTPENAVRFGLNKSPIDAAIAARNSTNRQTLLRR